MNKIVKNDKYKKVFSMMLLFLFLIISCGKKEEVNEYEVTEVIKGDVELSVDKTGQVVSDDVISVYTTASQRVEKVFFKEGDNVKKGDVVVTFYSVDRNETYRKIEAKRIEIEKLERNVRNAKELVKVGGESKVNLEDANISLRTAKLELATLEEDLALIKTEITSPVDGVITTMTADENYRVNTETPLFKVADVNNIKAEVSLSDSQIKDVEVGQKVIVSSDALGKETVEGYVAEISGVATKSANLDESTTVVTIKFNNNDNVKLRPGTTINATIYYKETKGILKVPYTSVINEEGKYYVFKINGENVVSKTEVEIGVNDTSFYEIKKGLNEKDKIILIVDEILKDGEKVKIATSETKKENKGKPNGPAPK